ncbi:hypothetical protein AQUCO_02200145v1 [Aquilegia coerulea]|uniref:6-phosphogluconate dehydrogenase NADP-binding domain-containing protein n=1 Tax=Aquilegia coerulea TaxID=218851 RepID=A0A2G5DDB2_AQUCA|nr:hypothetical protein AQUCO_02200145v1 [Aquilegia coerulea]
MDFFNKKDLNPSETKVGWIGIGVMGGAMASRILSAGFTLIVYARTPEKARWLETLGAILVNSPAEVAQKSDVVFTMVGHPSDVRSVVLNNDGVLSNLSKGGVFVDHTSSHPELAREISAKARLKDCWAIDAPVSGGDIGAKEGRLAIFAGGDCNVVKWLTPLFQIMGKPTYVGESGCGQSCKIANQITVSANLVGLSEGLVFAKQAGLDLKQFVESVKGGAAGSMVMELFGERMIERDFKAGAFAEYIVKDLGMSLEGKEEKAVVLPGAALSKQLFLSMVANGDEKMGIQGLVTVTERLNGK